MAPKDKDDSDDEKEKEVEPTRETSRFPGFGLLLRMCSLLIFNDLTERF